MLKLTIQVTENKETDTCNVQMVTPKDLSKATSNEKTVGSMVANELTKALQSLQNNQNIQK